MIEHTSNQPQVTARLFWEQQPENYASHQPSVLATEATSLTQLQITFSTSTGELLQSNQIFTDQLMYRVHTTVSLTKQWLTADKLAEIVLNEDRYNCRCHVNKVTIDEGRQTGSNKVFLSTSTRILCLVGISSWWRHFLKVICGAFLPFLLCRIRNIARVYMRALACVSG